MSLINFDLPEELKPVISEFGCDRNGIIRLTFTHVYDKISLNFIFRKDIPKFFIDFEKRLKDNVRNISPHDYNLIEDIIFKNLDKISETSKSNGHDGYNFDNKAITSNHIQKHLRKYEFESILYEAVIVDKRPKFISYSNGTLNFYDKLDLSNYVIYPADNLMSHNPIPYVFESEQEVQKYIELAKKETKDSLLEKLLTEFSLYLNAKEHTQIILAAGTLSTYFQNKFGTTHYNIFVGENGSGKNSALSVIRMLGYRPFYVTSVSPANIYTFLGDVQEGQGIILEDEADDIGRSSEKKNILKTGYCSGGSVPKVGFKEDGNRYQDSYLTYCFKCFAMEELPGGKTTRGIFDRSFIHHLFKGEVLFNIKNIMADKESDLYKNLIHLRKLLLAYKLINYDLKFPEINTNLTARDAELTYPLLRMFYGHQNFERIRKGLSEIIFDKTTKKSNSIEAKITETLITLGNNENNRNSGIIVFTNEEFQNTFKEVAEAKDNPYDVFGSTLLFPDGTKITKYNISNLLTSKFNAKPNRTNKSRGYRVNRADIEKISKQYQVIEDIIIYDDKNESKKVTQVTQVTEFKDATPPFSSISNIQDNDNDESKIRPNGVYQNEFKNNDNDDQNRSKNNKENDKLYSENDFKDTSNYSENKIDNLDNKNYEVSGQNNQIKTKTNKILTNTPLKSVTRVTGVTATPLQYPCCFCGNSFKTHIDFDMGNHFVEKHKDQLIRLPMSGNREEKIDWAILETKRRLADYSISDQEDED